MNIAAVIVVIDLNKLFCNRKKHFPIYCVKRHLPCEIKFNCAFYTYIVESTSTKGRETITFPPRHTTEADALLFSRCGFMQRIIRWHPCFRRSLTVGHITFMNLLRVSVV